MKSDWEPNARTFYNAAKIAIDSANTYRDLLARCMGQQSVRLNDIERARRLLEKAAQIYAEGFEARQAILAGEPEAAVDEDEAV